MKISLRIETRFRFMYQQSYFSGDFSTYTPKYVDKTSHFANNLYFGHNAWTSISFKSEISIQVYMIPNRHLIPDRVFNREWKMEWTRSRMSCNSIRIHISKYNSIPYDLSRNGMSSIRIETQSGLMHKHVKYPLSGGSLTTWKLFGKSSRWFLPTMITLSYPKYAASHAL